MYIFVFNVFKNIYNKVYIVLYITSNMYVLCIGFIKQIINDQPYINTIY